MTVGETQLCAHKEERLKRTDTTLIVNQFREKMFNLTGKVRAKTGRCLSTFTRASNQLPRSFRLFRSEADFSNLEVLMQRPVLNKSKCCFL